VRRLAALLRVVLALTEIRFSHSTIEARWRTLTDLQQQPGHAELATTQIYASALSARRRAAVMALDFGSGGRSRADGASAAPCSDARGERREPHGHDRHGRFGPGLSPSEVVVAAAAAQQEHQDHDDQYC